LQQRHSIRCVARDMATASMITKLTCVYPAGNVSPDTNNQDGLVFGSVVPLVNGSPQHAEYRPERQ
jgi:hypothetical protein